MRAYFSHTTGFTLIELIVVVALLSLITGVGIVMSYSSIARANVIQERDTLVSLLLSGARARALANINESSHGVHIDAANHRYILFEGTSYPNNTEPSVAFNEDLIIAASSDDIIFEQRSGNVLSGNGAITLTLNGRDIMFDINEAGRIDW